MDSTEALITTVIVLAAINILTFWFVGKGWATRKKSRNGWRD
jgi:hypothetical protein